MSLRLGELWVYPVKSLAGARVARVEVDDRGLRDDRRFMVVRPSGVFVTQRELPRMALVSAAVVGATLRLEGPDGAALELPIEGPGPTVSARVWDDEVEALDQGDEVAGFLSAQLGAELRLVRMPESTRRPAEPSHAREGDLVSFADAYPFLLVTDGSLDAFFGALGARVDVRRFRPTLVVHGASAFAEDGWKRLRVGDITFHVRKACARCQIVNVDPDRGEPDKAPLAKLTEMRRDGNRVLFGQNLVHDGRGLLREGAEVVLLS